MKTNRENGERIRALIIDDSREVLTALKLGLEFAGLDVSAAQNLSGAKALLIRETFDVVICDFLMPGMNGWEFRSQMQTRLKLPPFIFCSGMARETFGKHPQVEILEKPFSIRELVEKIKAIQPSAV